MLRENEGGSEGGGYGGGGGVEEVRDVLLGLLEKYSRENSKMDLVLHIVWSVVEALIRDAEECMVENVLDDVLSLGYALSLVSQRLSGDEKELLRGAERKLMGEVKRAVKRCMMKVARIPIRA